MNDTKRELLRCVSNGISTTKDLADHLGLDRGHINKVLLEMVDDGSIVREKGKGGSYHYYTPDIAPDSVVGDDADDHGDAESTPAASMADHMERLLAEAKANPVDTDEFGVFDNETGAKVDKGFNWDAHVPGPIEYIPTDGEYDEIMAEIELREAVGKPFHGRIVGPTGSAKTTLVKAIAHEKGWPVFTISASYSLSDVDIIGYSEGVKTDADGDPMFNYGPGALALMASADRPTVLLVDEVNRAPARAKGAMFSLLDFRAALNIGFTGEKVAGNPLNLILFSTMNTGAAYGGTDRLDLAEARRLGGEWEIDYLGENHPEREVALIMSRAPVNRALAEDMVKAANFIREDVANNPDSPYKIGIPTPNLIDWARAAAMYQARDLDNPVVRAMRKHVLTVYKVVDEGRGTAAAEVESYLEQKFRGREVEPPGSTQPTVDETVGDDADDDEDDEGLDRDADQFGCMSCGHVFDAEEAENAGYICPEADCGSSDITAI